MAVELYLSDPFNYDDVDFIIKAFHNTEQAEYVVKAFYADNSKANNFSYTVSYENKADLLANTGDNAVALLIEHAKNDIRAGYHFRNNLH